jgi:predicted thioredoxin/glutaredoxin
MQSGGLSGLTVVHRQDCDLCDEMLAELKTLAETVELPPVTVLDVDADPELLRRYGLHVPVLLFDGSVVCRHRLDAVELRRLARGWGQNRGGPAQAPAR